MVIKRSAAAEIRQLIADLDAEDDVQREAAIARLAVIGTRAVDRLVALLVSPGVGARATVSALRALEATGDIRALAPARELLASPDGDVGAAAVSVLRTFLSSKHGTDVLDRLVAVSLDPVHPETTRLAALDALAETGSRVATPVWERLRDDASLAVRQRAAKEAGVADPPAEIEAAAAGVLPDDPDALRLLVGKVAATAPLATLHRVVEAVKAREAKERSQASAAAWQSARASVHAALAARNSRVALYDLRETIARAVSPLPAGFLESVAVVGDADALDAIASAYARGVIAGNAEWLDQLRLAFRTIADREHLGPRSAVMKRIGARWPTAGEALIEKKISRPSRSTRG